MDQARRPPRPRRQGVVFLVIGVFLTQAALQTNPDEPRGLGGALSALATQPFGPYLLGLVAFGLVAFGASSCSSSPATGA
jgi:Na+/proline symporter